MINTTTYIGVNVKLKTQQVQNFKKDKFVNNIL